jgi:23S rRNA (adenine2503-C2)-methyltransferase
MEVSRYGATHAELEALLRDEPRYRVEQVWDALWRRRVPLADATELPSSLRARLDAALPLALHPVVEVHATDDRTTKWRWATSDGAQVETVLMHTARRASVCVSSQAGCAMACPFCATGQAGFERHLDAAEIVEQVLRAQHATDQRVTNVVYMGMGEPLANYEPVWDSVTRLHDALGLSARRLTVSTVGVVPGMRRLAREALPVTLAVSLHAPNDELRAQLVPLNHRYPIAEILDAAADVAGAHGRRVTFEYAGIAGVNDSPAQADALARLLSAWPGVGGAHVNLIPLNPTAGYPGRAASPARLHEFARRLKARGVTATVRRTQGRDIDAACGQLRRPSANTETGVASTTMGP